MTKGRTLALIAAFVAFMLGSFIWFIATWDADNRAPVGHLNTSTGATV